MSRRLIGPTVEDTLRGHRRFIIALTVCVLLVETIQSYGFYRHTQTNDDAAILSDAITDTWSTSEKKDDYLLMMSSALRKDIDGAHVRIDNAAWVLEVLARQHCGRARAPEPPIPKPPRPRYPPTPLFAKETP